jgi:UDP-glucose 4-epimerase
MAAKANIRKIIYTSSTAVNDWMYMDNNARAGGVANSVFEDSKQNPVTYYGATKGATELFLKAIAFKHKIRFNIVRPGYVFGNPVVEDASNQADARFREIVLKAKTNDDIELIKNDGTQFIWAGDLAKIYLALLNSDQHNRTWFGLGSRFITWEEIAYESLSIIGSKSTIKLIDMGWPEKPALFDVTAIQQEFGFSFDPWNRIREHIQYLYTTL